MNKFERLWANSKFSFWFLPTLIIVASILLALILIYIDSHVDRLRLIEDWPFLLFAGPEGSRTMLSTIAGSMITVAGVVFSITILALAQASTQYSPRVLRHFIGDRTTQIILGAISGIFIYCLLILRVLHSADMPPAPEFVPPFSLLFGFILSLVGVGCVIYFIHHIANMLQASTIIEDIAHTTLKAIDRYYLQQSVVTTTREEQERKIIELKTSSTWNRIPALKTGFIQLIFPEALLNVAEKHNMLVRIEHSIGAFVISGMPLASVNIQNVTPNIIKEVNQCFEQGSFRTLSQDIAFGIQQLVDISLKALTSGVNDITTAVTCVDYLTVILVDLTKHKIASPFYYKNDKIRIIYIHPVYEKFLGIAFNQLCRNIQGNMTMMIRVLHSLEVIAQMTVDKKPQQHALLRHIDFINETAKKTIGNVNDSEKISTKCKRLREFIGREG